MNGFVMQISSTKNYFFQLLSGEKEVDKIISKFIKEEEENYALFNYVNELSHEIETLH